MLEHFGIKDDRIRSAPCSRILIAHRLAVRVLNTIILLALSIPGLVLWSPVFVAARWSESRVRARGAALDVMDEV